MSLDSAVKLFMLVLVACVIFVAMWWLVDFIGLPPPFGHALHVVLAILAVLVGVGALLRLYHSTGG